jgi:hypothetical protein
MFNPLSSKTAGGTMHIIMPAEFDDKLLIGLQHALFANVSANTMIDIKKNRYRYD